MARFDHLTETAGTPASREGLDMLYTRYDYVRTLAAGKRVLELACGSGQGLGLIAKSAKWTVGGDIDSTLLDIDLPDLYRGHGLFFAEPLTERPGQRVVSTHTLRQLASDARVRFGG